MTELPWGCPRPEAVRRTLQSWELLGHALRRAATTLGLSSARWPPPHFDRDVWLRRRLKYEVVAVRKSLAFVFV